MQQDRVERRAEHVVLALVERAVADPHGTRARVAGEIVARGLGQVAPPVDPVHDLQRPVAVGLEVGDELHELLCLPVEVEVVQGLQSEGRVAQPGVAVVPVALAPGRLGQRGRQRRDRRAGRHVGKALDRERRALDRVAPAVIRHARTAQPAAPEAGGAGQPCIGVVDVFGRRELLGPRERAVDLLSLPEHVTGSYPVALHADCHVRLQPDRLPCVACLALFSGGALGARVGPVTAVGNHPVGGYPPVIEDRFARQLHLDLPLQAHREAHEQVVGVLVSGGTGVRRDEILAATRPQDQRLAHDRPAGRGLPGREQDVGSGLIAASRRHVDPERAEAKAAGLAVEQRAEHAGASKRGTHSQSIVPSGATSAPVWQSDRKA